MGYLNPKYRCICVKMGKFYMGIKDPMGLRKALLDCSRGILKSLQNYEDYNSLRDRKVAYILKLKEDVAEINRLSAKLRSILPEEEEKKKHPKKSKKKTGEYDIGDLSEELSEIEAKMSKLNI